MKSVVEVVKKQIEDIALESGWVWFLETHIKKVLENASFLCSKLPEADKEVVELSVWLHDIYYFMDFSKQKAHAVLGAVEAEKRLRELRVSEDVIAKVVHAIRCHSCREEKPESLEAKILATADAMSHFNPYFFLSLAAFTDRVEKGGFDAFREYAIEKLDKDMNKKILFDFARERVRKDYEELKKFFSYDLKG